MPSSPAAASVSHRPGLFLVILTLLVYGTLSYLRNSETWIWDEARYLEYAQNISQGFYVTDDEPNFVNGPAYPLVLLPFMGGESMLAARLLNAFFMAGAVGFVWLTVRHYAGALWAFGAAAFIGFHPTLLWMGFSLMTESMSTFTLTGFVWAFTHALRDRRWYWIALASLLLGWLIMTRVFFGHVLMATSVMCGVLLIIKDWRPALLRALAVLAGAFILCIPYLGYTQAKTGQVLCWSTNSGQLLYWLCSHHEGENGHWFGLEDVRTLPEVSAQHDAFYEEVMKKPILERERMFKEAAVANFKEDPVHVAYNWACNLTRLAFGFPRSYQVEELRTIVLIVTNGPLIFLSVIAGALGLWRWRQVPVEIWVLMGFTAFYLGGSTLAPCLPRYFVLVAPILLLGIAQVFHRHVRVQVIP